MTQTPNIGLKKIDGSENWRSVFDYHNDSMDLADEAIAGVRAGLTYVEDGDTIAANASYTEGKFISWKGEIYRILTTINTTVTSANWTTYLAKQDGIGGALSQINGDLASLNSKIAHVDSAAFVTSILGGSGTSSDSKVVNHHGIKKMDIYFQITTGGQLAPLTEYYVGSISEKPFNNLDIYFVGNRLSGGDAPFTIKIDGNGEIKLNPLTTIPSGVTLVAYASYHYT